MALHFDVDLLSHICYNKTNDLLAVFKLPAFVRLTIVKPDVVEELYLAIVLAVPWIFRLGMFVWLLSCLKIGRSDMLMGLLVQLAGVYHTNYSLLRRV